MVIHSKMTKYCLVGLIVVWLSGSSVPLVAQIASSLPNNTLNLYLPVKKDAVASHQDHLKKALSNKGLGDIQVRFADHWQNYQQALRTGKPGIYLAAPHFSAWAISRHNFKPLVRLREPLRYAIATHRSDASIFEINDLAGRSVCTQKPLNIDYLLIGQAFENKILSATPISVASVVGEMRAKQSHCDAFALSDHHLETLARELPNKYIRLYQSPSYNNYVFLTHPRVNPVIQNKLEEFLLDPAHQQVLQPILTLFAGNPRLVKSKARDYPQGYLKQLTPYWPNPAIDQ